jgi:deoxyadenosine/deoxycytidine kinase
MIGSPENPTQNAPKMSFLKYWNIHTHTRFGVFIAYFRIILSLKDIMMLYMQSDWFSVLPCSSSSSIEFYSSSTVLDFRRLGVSVDQLSLCPRTWVHFDIGIGIDIGVGMQVLSILCVACLLAVAVVQGLAPAPSKTAISYGGPNQFNPILVSIEGNIGAGKSTLLKTLRERNADWIFIDEPVSTWSSIRNEADESILEVFYKDRKRWSYTFQNCALLTRYQNIETAVQNAIMVGKVGPQVFLTERCLDTDYHVFTKMLCDEGSIDKMELHLYQRLLDQLKTTATPLNAIVHVNTPPTECAARIRERARSGEGAISLDYLTALDYHQSAWVESTPLRTCATLSTRSCERVQEVGVICMYVCMYVTCIYTHTNIQ